MKTVLFCLLVLGASMVQAGSTDVWQGSGVLFGLNGQELSNYELLVENTTANGKTVSQVTVTLPDGSKRQQSCVVTEKGPEGWKSDCGHGKGGGRCFGEGLCLSYESDAQGNAYATTIVFDSPKSMRLLRTQLKNGKAVRFFREKLQKISSI